MQVLVDELVVNYEITGDGPTLLLVHGWADSLNTFVGLQKSLSTNYRVLSLDLPGFGKTSKPPEPWGLNNYADFLASFVKKLDLNIYAFIGHSNGGAILIYGLANNVISASKLVLLSSAGIRNKQSTKKKALKVVAKSGKVLTAVLPSSMKSSIRDNFYSQIGSDYLVAPDMQDTFRLVIGKDILDDAKKLKLPTLLIYGRDDKATPIEDGKLLQGEISGSRLEILDNIGHFVHQEQSELVDSLIKDFLQ